MDHKFTGPIFLTAPFGARRVLSPNYDNNSPFTRSDERRTAPRACTPVSSMQELPTGLSMARRQGESLMNTLLPEVKSIQSPWRATREPWCLQWTSVSLGWWLQAWKRDRLRSSRMVLICLLTSRRRQVQRWLGFGMMSCLHRRYVP